MKPLPILTAQLEIAVHQIFQNARFIVTASPTTAAVPTFEINVVGEQPTVAFLYGASANYLSDVIKSWQINTPDEDQVEAVLESLLWCNATPLLVH